MNTETTLAFPGLTTHDGVQPGAVDPAHRIRDSGKFSVADIPLLARTFQQHEFARGTPWDMFRRTHLELPAWFQHGLDPLSEAYFAQQKRLWSTITGVHGAYQPEIHEKESPWAGDAVRFPAGFVRRDAESIEAMSDHILATGMLLKYSGLRPGDTALEYGAGFAQTALQFARLGVRVDTVDISAAFCKAVQEQADFFGVPLQPFEGQFGWNPRGNHQYNLIWFYESFHHCLEFRSVLGELKRNLAPAGRILLAGEPVVRALNDDVPFPWGVRLDSANVAVMGCHPWFELGFTEDFLTGLFVNAGFSAQRMVCGASTYGDGYIFQHRAPSIELSSAWLPCEQEKQWQGAEPSGRWTRGEASLHVDTTDTFRKLAIECHNHHPAPLAVEVLYGDQSYLVKFERGERREITLRADRKSPQLSFKSRTFVPAADYGRADDDRALGIFVNRVVYLTT